RGHRAGHRRPDGVVRRHHGHHRPARPGRPGPGLAAGSGGRGRRDGAGDDGRRPDPAAGPAGHHGPAGRARGTSARPARAGRGRRADGPRWARWSGLVQRRPWPMLLAAAAVLLALSAPALGMRLGFADAGNDARSTTSRQAYDLLAKGFGPGFNSPLIVVADGGEAAAGALHHAIAGTAGVAAVTPPAVSPDGKITTMVAFPAAKPQDA